MPILLTLIVILIHYYWLSTDLFNELECNGKEECDGYIRVFTHIAAVLSLYFFALRIFHQEKQVDLQIQQTDNQKKQIELQIKHRVDDRFTSAIELLGSSEQSVRIGGIYSLYYLAIEEKKYKETIMNVICSHIRSQTTESAYQEEHSYNPSNEIQIAIDLLFRDKGLYYEQYDHISNNPNLKGSFLIGVDFTKSDCRYVDFEKAILDESNFDNANCQSANFKESSCVETIFSHALLEKSILDYANFSGAELNFTRLNKTSTFNTDFENAKFYNTEFKEVHCSLDAKFSEGVKVNINSQIEKETRNSETEDIMSMSPEGNYIINPH